MWLRGKAAGLSLPKHHVRCLPQRLARAVVGHLLAVDLRDSRVAELNTAAMLARMREFFLQPAVLTPPELEMFWWPYAHDTCVIARHFGIMRYGRTGVLVADLIKFFPVAFMVVYSRPDFMNLQLARFPIAPGGGIDDELEVFLDIVPVPRPDWPE